MASTTFTDNVTPIISAWLNDVDSVTYDIFGDGSSFTGNITLNTNKFTVEYSSGNTVIGGTLTVAGDAAVNGGDLTSSATTFNLLNATVTTLNIGGAATSFSLGANTGVSTFRGVLQGAFVPRINVTYSGGDATPSVLDTGFLSITNGGPTTITNFDDGVAGQLIYLFFNDANTTVDRSNCVLAGGANFVSSANDVLVLYKTNTVWAEVCRSVNS